MSSLARSSRQADANRVRGYGRRDIYRDQDKYEYYRESDRQYNKAGSARGGLKEEDLKRRAETRRNMKVNVWVWTRSVSPPPTEKKRGHDASQRRSKQSPKKLKEVGERGKKVDSEKNRRVKSRSRSRSDRSQDSEKSRRRRSNSRSSRVNKERGRKRRRARSCSTEDKHEELNADTKKIRRRKSRSKSTEGVGRKVHRQKSGSRSKIETRDMKSEEANVKRQKSSSCSIVEKTRGNGEKLKSEKVEQFTNIRNSSTDTTKKNVRRKDEIKDGDFARPKPRPPKNKRNKIPVKTGKCQEWSESSSSSSSSSSDSDSSSSSDSDRRKKRRKRKSRKRKKKRKRYSSSSSNSEDSTSSSDTDSRKKRKKRRQKKRRKTKVEEVLVPGPTLPAAKDDIEGDESDEEWEEVEDLQPAVKLRKDEDTSDEDTGPKLFEGRASLLNEKDYGVALQRGEALAIASYVQKGMRIPRRGEVGLTSEDITKYEDMGFVMSGSRHKRMNAIRIRKENQIYSAEEKRALSLLNMEERANKEVRIHAKLQNMLRNKALGPVDQQA